MNEATNSNIKEELSHIEAAKRNPADFAPLYGRYYKPIFVFVYRRVFDEQCAADIASQVFLKALVNIQKYKFKGFPFSSWLFRIAVNECNMYFRNKKKVQEVSISESEIKNIMQGAEVEENEDNLQKALDALNELSDKETQLIELRFFEQLSFKQISGIFGITEANAKVRVYRILKKMKKIISTTNYK